MPPEDDKQTEDSSSLPKDISEDYSTEPNPVNLPRETIQEQIPPARSHVAKKPLVKKLAVILAIVLLLGASAFAVWKFVIDKKDEVKSTENNQSQSQASEQSAGDEQLQPEELTESFKSDFLRLEFKHPESWKVTETDNVILVKSPSLNLKIKAAMNQSTISKSI